MKLLPKAWVAFGCAAAAAAPAAGQPEGGHWRGMHVMISSAAGVPALKRLIREALAPLGVNALVLDPEHTEAHWVLGWVLVELRRTDDAVGEFETVIKLVPDTDRAAEAQKAIDRLKQ